MWCRKGKGGGGEAVVYYFVFERKTYGGTVRLLWKQRNWEGHFPIREAEVAPRSLVKVVKTTTRKAMLVLTEKSNLESVLDALGGR